MRYILARFLQQTQTARYAERRTAPLWPVAR